MTTVAASKWIRVNKRNRCPVCDKPDWCLKSEDSKTAICARIESDKLAGNKGAGWHHTLDMAGLIHAGAGKGMTAQGRAEFVEKNNFLHQSLGGGVNV